jgi:hypothetical protein
VADRNLEFTLTQIQLQLEQILEAFQTLMNGRIPANLLSFGKLHDHCELFKVLAFATRVSNASFVRFYLENKYFAISIFRQTHFILNELEFLQCKGDSNTLPRWQGTKQHQTKYMRP